MGVIHIYIYILVIQTSRVFRVESIQSPVRVESSQTETRSSQSPARVEPDWNPIELFLMIIKFKDLNYLIKCIEMYHIISVYIYL